MKLANESGIDRIIRVVLGVVLIALAWGGIVSGGWSVAFIVIGALALLTGVVGFCPAYFLLKIRTKRA